MLSKSVFAHLLIMPAVGRTLDNTAEGVKIHLFQRFLSDLDQLL